jgi:hypothetical protein
MNNADTFKYIFDPDDLNLMNSKMIINQNSVDIKLNYFYIRKNACIAPSIYFI